MKNRQTGALCYNNDVESESEAEVHRVKTMIPDRSKKIVNAVNSPLRTLPSSQNLILRKYFVHNCMHTCCITAEKMYTACTVSYPEVPTSNSSDLHFSSRKVASVLQDSQTIVYLILQCNNLQYLTTALFLCNDFYLSV